MDTKNMDSDPFDVCPNMTAQHLMCTGDRGGITGECDSCMERALENIKKEKTKSSEQRRKDQKKLLKKKRKAAKSQKTEEYEIEELTSRSETDESDDGMKEEQPKGSVGDCAETGTATGHGTSPQVVSHPPVKVTDAMFRSPRSLKEEDTSKSPAAAPNPNLAYLTATSHEPQKKDPENRTEIALPPTLPSPHFPIKPKSKRFSTLDQAQAALGIKDNEDDFKESEIDKRLLGLKSRSPADTTFPATNPNLATGSTADHSTSTEAGGGGRIVYGGVILKPVSTTLPRTKPSFLSSSISHHKIQDGIQVETSSKPARQKSSSVSVTVKPDEIPVEAMLSLTSTSEINRPVSKQISEANQSKGKQSSSADALSRSTVNKPQSEERENRTVTGKQDEDTPPADTNIREQIPESTGHYKQKGSKGKQKRSKKQVTKKDTNVTEGNGNGADPNKPSTSKASRPRKPHGKNETEQEKREQYEQDGKEIKADYCKTEEGPTMFPPVPSSPYIDKFPEGSQLTKGNKQDQRRQEDDEAEVYVFRALESLGSAHGRNMVALQGLEYTHGQYSLFVGDHESAKKKDCQCTMKNKEIEGECDFVVMGPNYVVVLEVKNVESNDGTITIEQQKKVFLDNLKKARDQAERTVQLVEKIQEHVCSGTSTTVLRFASFPGFEKGHLDGFQLEDDELKDIVFKEDLQDFNNWWENNVRTKVSSDLDHFLEEHQKVEHILLSLWCDQKGKCNKDKCSLGHCIKETDKKLKDANVTFRRKKHDHNPAIEEAPDVFKKYIGINNLTVEQYELYNSTQNALWVNGPAGSGKTILMLAKIIQLVSEVHAEEKVVLFTFGRTESSREKCESVLHKADIKFELIYTDYGKHTSHELSELILEQSSQVVIVVVTDTVLIAATWFKDTVSLLDECHMLLDDVQCVLTDLWGEEEEEEVADFIRSISERVKHTSLEGTTRTTWIACDMVQALWDSSVSHISNIAEQIRINLPDKMQVTLSVNLRNTFDICNMLTVIRGEYSGQYSTDALNVVLPIQQPGHYIHGMRPVLHILPCRDKDLIRDIVVHELDKLCQSGGLQQNTDIGIVYTYSNIESVLVAIAEDRSNQSGQITVCHMEDSYSAEWPAGIVVHGMLGDTYYYNDLCNLYLTVSRARVYCSIIVYPREDKTLEDCKEMIRLFNKLDTNLVQVKRY